MLYKTHKETKPKYVIFLISTLSAPIPKNGQTHSNNSSATTFLRRIIIKKSKFTPFHSNTFQKMHIPENIFSDHIYLFGLVPSAIIPYMIQNFVGKRLCEPMTIQHFGQVNILIRWKLYVNLEFSLNKPNK